MSELSLLENTVVTGATGFIGRHTVRALVTAGCRPTLVTRSTNHDDSLREFGEKVRWVTVDLTEPNSARELLLLEKPKILIHLAGTRGRNDARGSAAACEELNFRVTEELLRAATVSEVQRIVILGSAEEYGNQPGPHHEALPSLAASAYGISKARTTKEAMNLFKDAGCPVVVVRPFSVYGPGQPSDMFIAEAVDAAVRNVEFRMSLGEQKRDLIFVEDVVRGLIAAASAPGIEGRVINLGTGVSYRLREVAELIWKLTGADSPLLIGARHAPAEELYDTWADITLARRLLGWTPRVGLETGLERTIEFARVRLEAKAQRCQVM